MLIKEQQVKIEPFYVVIDGWDLAVGIGRGGERREARRDELVFL